MLRRHSRARTHPRLACAVWRSRGHRFSDFVLAAAAVFRYTNDDVAPRVMSQVISRAPRRRADRPCAERLRSGSRWRMASLCWKSCTSIRSSRFCSFTAWAARVASHVVYLQQTKQYNSNQLVAVLVLVTLILLVLVSISSRSIGQSRATRTFTCAI